MTTTIKVSARCRADQQVRIVRASDTGVETNIILRDGETEEVLAYDDWIITVREEAYKKDLPVFSDADSAAGLRDTPQPVREFTFGEKAVGLAFNPGGFSDVTNLKQKAAAFIDAIHALRENSLSSEIARMASVAVTEAQTAQMWAVKAATWSN